MEELYAEVERQAEAWRARIAELRGRHVAIEALWDGDTQGWWLGVAVVTKKSWWRAGPWTTSGFYARSIGTLRYGGDIRLFKGIVPPWPEAIVAQRAGEKVARLLGLEFYFPSPNRPDDDCPHWWERERATTCRTCGKPLTVGRGPHVPADQCTPCFIDEREKNALIADAPGRGRSIACIVEASGIRGSALLFDLDHSHAAFRGWLAAALRNRQPPIELSQRIETALTPEEARAIQTSCEQQIDERLRAYEPTGRRLPAGFSSRRSFSWRGVEHSIETHFNPVGEEIGQLLGVHNLLGEAVAGGVLHLFGNGGVTERDASILATLRRGPRTRSELQAAYPFLPPDAVERTLSKLEQRGFVARDGEALRLLLKGGCILVAGP
jgi:hypothetical protein